MLLEFCGIFRRVLTIASSCLSCPLLRFSWQTADKTLMNDTQSRIDDDEIFFFFFFFLTDDEREFVFCSSRCLLDFRFLASVEMRLEHQNRSLIIKAALLDQ